MIEEYLFRGKVVYEFETDRESELPIVSFPKALPISIGQFTIDLSPNQKAYVDNTFGEEIFIQTLDHDYPLSLLYVDVKVKVGEDESPTWKADEAMRNLEAMLRLYKPGGIYVRRHFQTWKVIDGNPRKTIFLDFGTKPEPNLYDLGSYIFDDKLLTEFGEFFNCFGGSIENKHQPIYNALLRFSSSYEKLTSADRLIDLMIALEALFNESSDSIAYKVSLRCSSLVGSTLMGKKSLFQDLKSLYRDRNLIVHGDKKEIEHDKKKIVHLENIVRKAIVEFLTLDNRDFPIGSLEALDDILFFNK